MASAPESGALSREALMAAGTSRIKWWLRRALLRYLAEGQKIAFAPFEDMIGRDDFLSADLHAIFRLVPVQHRAAWQEAVADLFAELPATEEHAEALGLLVEFARFMPAYELFERAGGRLRSPALARLRLRDGDTLFVKCLRLALELTAETKTMRDSLLALIQSGSFEFSYALQALAALARADPKNWLEHLARLRPQIEQLLLVDRPSRAGLKRHAAMLLDALGSQRLMEDVAQLRKAPEDASEEEQARSDDWLLDALILGLDPLIVQQESCVAGKSAFSPVEDQDIIILVADRLLNRPLNAPGPRRTPWRLAGVPFAFVKWKAGAASPKAEDLFASIEDGLLRKGFADRPRAMAMGETDG